MCVFVVAFAIGHKMCVCFRGRRRHDKRHDNMPSNPKCSIRISPVYNTLTRAAGLKTAWQFIIALINLSLFIRFHQPAGIIEFVPLFIIIIDYATESQLNRLSNCSTDTQQTAFTRINSLKGKLFPIAPKKKMSICQARNSESIARMTYILYIFIEFSFFFT